MGSRSGCSKPKRLPGDPGPSSVAFRSGKSGSSKRKRLPGDPGPSSEAIHKSLDDYVDLGNCDQICLHCGASFWYSERVTSTNPNEPIKYTTCCKSGQVRLKYPVEPPRVIKELFNDRNFLWNVRRYNSMFAMTSFGANVDESINDGSAPYVFKISGQVSHVLGSLCPSTDKKAKFLQLYIYDTANEISNRLSHFATSARKRLCPNIVSTLNHTLDRCNSLVKIFRTARDICSATDTPDFSIKLNHNAGMHCYDSPSDGTLGAIIYDSEPAAKDFDIIIRTKSNALQRVNILHSSYMSLQYPLLFPLGEPGWSSNMKLINVPSKGDKRLTMNMYYSYQIHDRPGKYTLVLQGGRLFQQYLVDAYVQIECNRLDYIEHNQKKLRSDFLNGVYDAVARGDTQGRDIGKRIILPSSFTGSPRYMYKHYQDALAICRVHGKPQYFITFTCNVNWPEITRYMQKTPLLTPQDKPDIIARVFQMKVKSFISFLKEKRPFGVVAADLYTIEFQKRGLPHCHTLLWVTDPYKIREADQIDEFISAEIPDKQLDPVLYDIVTETMIHGPCGLLDLNATCMQEGHCSKKFPKDYEPVTRIDDNGKAYYKRRSKGPTVNKKGSEVDCGFVIPYNRSLCLRFHAHINVEYCGWSMAIKYLFKYISKGSDRVKYTISANTINNSSRAPDPKEKINEIKNYVDGRFICPHEAAWRIFNFPIHQRNPAVQALAVHLEGEQNITFDDESNLENVLQNPCARKTTLTEWFYHNRVDRSGRHLRYVDYPSEYRWDASHKLWIRRSSKKTPSIGRLIYIHPSSGELFYLRMLLNHKTGCTSFNDLRTISNERFPNYRSACEKLGLIGDDVEWTNAFDEAAVWATPKELRLLFAHMLLYCEVTNPVRLWNEKWSKMSDDIVLNITTENNIHTNCIPPADIQQCIMYEIENTLNTSASYSTLSNYGLPMPQGELLERIRNRLLMEERCYDIAFLASQHERLKASMNSKQLQIYETVMNAHHSNNQILLFIYGHGGTGKTYLWTTIISAIRSLGKVVLAVAASGIAALLLPAGRTAHSRFRIPINLTDQSVCSFKKNSQLAQLIRETSLIIWDEAPMSNRKCFECLDRTLKDILNNSDAPFGGKSILLGGDFRQTLPILSKSTRTQVIGSCLTRSHLWSKFTIMHLTENMRLHRAGISDVEKELIQQFSEWLINIGDGKLGKRSNDSEKESMDVEIPVNYLITDQDNPLLKLVEFIYDDNTLRAPTAENLSNKTIVCPRNDTTDEINQMVLHMAPGDVVCYLSTDTVMQRAHDTADPEMLYPLEYLNSLSFTGIPAHTLELKPNTPVILMRNINQTKGLCNGTRLIVTQLMPRVIEATIITGVSTGNRVYLPRICFVHDDKELPFILRRRQFPIRLCYAMTINKSQGQSLQKIGIYLPQPVFGHGQLYVALSRATSPNSIKILITPEEGQPSNVTKNIVYTDFLKEIESNKVHPEMI